MDELDTRWAAFRSGSCSLALCTAGALGGCGLVVTPFPENTYSGGVPCTLTAGQGDTAEVGSFESSISLQAGGSGELVLNGVPIEVGQQITFSIPTADLAFEITAVRRGLAAVGVTFEPRPSLPGISIDGDLEETFSFVSGAIHASAEAVLDVNDVDGTTRLIISCAGTLNRQ